MEDMLLGYIWFIFNVFCNEWIFVISIGRREVEFCWEDVAGGVWGVVGMGRVGMEVVWFGF